MLRMEFVNLYDNNLLLSPVSFAVVDALCGVCRRFQSLSREHRKVLLCPLRSSGLLRCVMRVYSLGGRALKHMFAFIPMDSSMDAQRK